MRWFRSLSCFCPVLQPIWGTADTTVTTEVASVSCSFTHCAAGFSLRWEWVRSTHPTPDTAESFGDSCAFLAAIAPPTFHKNTLTHLKLKYYKSNFAADLNNIRFMNIYFNISELYSKNRQPSFMVVRMFYKFFLYWQVSVFILSDSTLVIFGWSSLFLL